MSIALLLALQAAQAAPDLQLDVHATIRRVKIEQSGRTSLDVNANPDAGSHVDVQKPEGGRRRELRNAEVRVHAEARIADPAENRATLETTSPQ